MVRRGGTSLDGFPTYAPHVPRLRVRERGNIKSITQWCGVTLSPLCLSLLDQFEEELSASCIRPFCVKLLFQAFLSGKEIKRIEHFVGQRISELINPSANGADRNELALMVSYARLGANKAPTDVPPDGFEKCVSQLRGYWFVHSLTRRDARCLTCGPGYNGPGYKRRVTGWSKPMALLSSCNACKVLVATTAEECLMLSRS
jgi:hypothetical protein